MCSLCFRTFVSKNCEEVLRQLEICTQTLDINSRLVSTYRSRASVLIWNCSFLAEFDRLVCLLQSTGTNVARGRLRQTGDQECCAGRLRSRGIGLLLEAQD